MAPVAMDIPVMMGRSIHCRHAWPTGVRIAQFTFEELCGRPVGATDFISLCDSFDALAVTGIPQFTETSEDEARRFVTLVDLLYDKGKQMLCTGMCAPERLFDELKSKYEADVSAGSEA